MIDVFQWAGAGANGHGTDRSEPIRNRYDSGGELHSPTHIPRAPAHAKRRAVRVRGGEEPLYSTPV